VFDLRYFDNQYILSVSEFVEKDVFKDYLLAMKTLKIYYSARYKGWVLSFSQVGEVMEWFKKWKYEIDFLSSAEQQYAIDCENKYKKEVKHIRTREGIDFKSVLHSKWTPKEFQKESLIEMSRRNVSFLWDEAGLGKNFQDSFMGHYWFQQGFIDGLIIIVRNSLTYTWYSDFLEYGRIVKPSDVQIVDSGNKKNALAKFRDKKVIIIGNHIFNKMMQSHGDGIIDIKKVWGKTSLGLIIDEGQDFRNADSQKTSCLIDHSDQFSYKIDSTASPWNKFWQVYGQASIIDRSIIPMSQNEFKMYIAKDLGSTYDPYHINKYDPVKVKEIEDKLAPYVIRRLKKDIPEMKHTQIPQHIKFMMSKDHFDLYQEMKSRESLLVKKEHKGKINIQNMEKFFPYTTQVIDNPFLLRGKIEDQRINKILGKWSFDKDKRVEYLDELVKDIIEEQDDKIIVFDIHPLTLNMLAERYSKYNPVVIHGEMKVKEKEKFREEERKRFNRDNKTKIAFLSAQTSSAGGNWNTKCNRIVTFTQPSDSILFYQLGERVNRLDSTRDSIFTNLSFVNTFDIARYYRNVNKTEFSEKFNSGNLTEEEIEKLLNGVV